MKGIISIIVFFFICNISFALNKYVDSTGGNDTNPGTLLLPYKSITKINQIYSTLTIGDSILLKRNEVWHNTIIVAKNGIHIGAYGTGADPVISGMVDITSWTITGVSNVWQSNVIGGTNTYMSMVTKNNLPLAMGRWPNSDATNGGYATYDSMNSLTQIRSITAMPFNFTGMTLCMRKITDILARETVTSVSGTTINHENLTGTNYKGFDGYGYFIENGLLTLDAQNEWYFDPATRRLYMYSATSPGGIKISTIDNLVVVGGFDNTTFDNIYFEGGNIAGITIGSNLSNSTGTIINRCEFVNMGRDGIYGTNNNNTVVDSCYFNQMMNNGASFTNQGGNTINTTITHNVYKNIGVAGMNFLDYSNGYKASFEAITNGTSAVVGELGMTVKFNSIDTVGHVGIRFYQNNTFIDSNFVNYHNYITGDAGAINCFDNTFGVITETNRTIIGNICINGIGAGLGAGGFPNVNGIYIDDKSDGIIIRRNFVANLGWITGGFNGSCIYLHNVTNIDVLNNVGYNGGYAQITLAHDGNAVGMPLRNINVQNNLSFSKLNTARFMVVRTRLNDVGQIFNPLNNNRYWRPTLITGSTFQAVTNYQVAGQVVSDYTLPTWQTAFAGATNGPYDAASTQGGSNTGATDFVYNFTDHDSILVFTGLSYLIPQYNSPYQQVYNNSMVLSPYTGYIRIANGIAPPINKFPVVDAGANQSITLPVNSATLTGTGSDSDGVVVSYAWAQISGPNTATISPTFSTTTGTTNVSGLIQGIYQFQLTVTDNNGASSTAITRVTVNAAVNVFPTANAGADQNLTLPTSTTTLIGSGNDPDGSIVSYLWTKISGPTGGSITSPTSATTGITALQQGTYVFSLMVTDNQGATGSDLVQINVNPANLNPTANAGADQNITLPTSSTSLVGSGTDPDGSIASYLWTKISGPTGGIITSPTSATTGITSLQAGTYVYQLTVTDNLGLTGSDFVQIVVNPANIAPTANAGNDQVITLPTNTTALMGTGTDPDGSIVSYAWVKISGPTGGTVASPNSQITAINALQQGTYVYRLTVTDNLGLTGTDFVQIQVNPVVPPPNQPPVAVAGADQSITLPTNSATVDGSGSSDPDGTIVGYLWTKISGPSGGAITSSTSASTGITGLIQGAYFYQLRVTDNNGDTATDVLQITVFPANIAPTANAGPNQTITLPTNTTTLVGSGTDPDGTITAYLWTKIGGPTGGIITSPTSATTGITALIAGDYFYQLRVTDNSGDTATDVVQITVFAANIAPTANAGADQTITLPTNSTTLIGSGTDPDGSIVAYLWTKASGPTGGTITSSTTSTTGITGLTQGVYVYILKVTDNSGDTATDAVQITVNPIPAPLPPTANAGIDQIITLPINSVTLSGSAVAGTGSIVSQAWTLFSGPTGSVISTPSSFTTLVSNLQEGTYLFRLAVIDSNALTATDLIQVTVRPEIQLQKVLLRGYRF